METYETFPCACGKGNVVRRISNTSENRHRAYFACPDSKPKVKDWGCEYFLWEDELKSCPCGQGLCIARKSPKGVFYKCPIDGEKNCGYEELVRNNAKKVVAGSSSPEPSTPPTGNFLSSSGSATCSNCKYLSMRIKILEARLDLAKHPEDHPCQSGAALHELLDGLLVEDE